MSEEQQQSRDSESAYILVGVLILLTLAAFSILIIQNQSRDTLQTTNTARARSVNYYNAEDSMARGVAWIRKNSGHLASLFSRDNFYSNFDRSTPSVGSNDSGLEIPTLLKANGTNNSLIITNSGDLATAVFPVAISAEDGSNFDAQAEFASAALGDSLVRITLVDAVPVTAASDFGDPDDGNAAPATDFRPIFRVDSLNASDSGSHTFAYLTGMPEYNTAAGFYGRDFMEMRQSCDSYVSDDGAYNAGSNRNANCTIGSDGEVRIHQSEDIYGTAKTPDAINASAPFGGGVCADFDPGCPNNGETCEGDDSCAGPGLPVYQTWATYCPTDQGNVQANRNQTINLTVSSDAPAHKCWAQVSTRSPNGEIVLSSTDYPYFIEELDIANNSQLSIVPDTPNGVVELYVMEFTGNSFNGNQVVNTNNKPYQFRIHYLGNNDLTLNGTANVNAFLTAPNAGVTVSGNFTYQGSIRAASLTATGSGALRYDESGEEQSFSDLSLDVERVSQRYRY